MRKAIIILLFLIPGSALAQTDYRFTGRPLDSQAGLYYFNQRYYDPNIGRFTQPDPMQNFLVAPGLEQKTGMSLEEVLANPQRLNSYSYALNNPVNLVDPTGEAPKVSEDRQDRFNQASDYIRNDDSYWLIRDRDGNSAALDAIWNKSLDLSKNEEGEINMGDALDTFYDSVNVNWRDDKTLDADRADYLNRLHNLPNALVGEYGGDISKFDKLQHFVASARLAYKYGPRIAMFLGRVKEVQDGISSIFNIREGSYLGLRKQDEGYSRGDIFANQLGIFWLMEYQRGNISPSVVFNNW